MKYIIPALVVIMVVVGLISWQMTSRTEIGSAGPLIVAKDSTESRTNPKPTTADTLAVDSSLSAGNQFVISQVEMSEAGFVVIREDANGIPGEVIGVSEFLPQGTRMNLAIQTDRQVTDEVIYFELFHDNGDKQFDREIDSLVLDNQDNKIGAQRVIGEIPFMEAEVAE